MDFSCSSRSRVSWYEAQEIERGIHTAAGGPVPPSPTISATSPSKELILLDDAERERKQHQKVVSRLAERAEKAEVEASQLKVELESMKDLASARALVGKKCAPYIMPRCHVPNWCILRRCEYLWQ